MYYTPEDGARDAEKTARQAARIQLQGLASTWLDGRDPHEPTTQRDAVITVAALYTACGRANAEHLRDGCRVLLGLRGADAMQAMAHGLAMGVAEGHLHPVNLGGSDVRYRRQDSATMEQHHARVRHTSEAISRSCQDAIEGRPMRKVDGPREPVVDGESW